MDFVLYGERGLVGIETKMAQQIRPEDLRSLRRFKDDYPQAKVFLIYAGRRRRHDAGIDIVPAEEAIRTLGQMIA